MKRINHSTRKILIALICLSAFAAAARGQDQSSTAQKDDVIRVNTELVQTSVTVTDKSGRFVEGLQRDQFELRVDGKPQPVSFFDRVTAGSAQEEQLAARTGSNTVTATVTPATASYRGRTIVFFIDDMHLSLQSMGRTRETLLHFIDQDMGPRDIVAIATASGQVGFLEQFTDNKEVLKAAVARLSPRPNTVQAYGTGTTPMSDYMALTIDSKADDKVLAFYIEQCMMQSGISRKASGMIAAAMRATCETQTKNTARGILMQSANIIQNTYNTLASLMRSSARLPGRKLAFFISDGFLLDTGPRGTSFVDKLHEVTDAAVRSGMVIYTIDARGLFSGQLDATNNIPSDANGRLASVALREATAYQDPLNALAGDTGGRALRNQNDFDRWIEKSLDETSNYYLLAWRPETEEQKEKRFRKIEVSIVGRPELTVRLPKGYLAGANAVLASNNASTSTSDKSPSRNAVPQTPDAELRDALTDFYSRGSLPTLLSLNYLNTPGNGTVLTSSMQVASSALTYGADGKQPATVYLAGVILSDKGKIITSFKNHLNVNPLGSNTDQSDPSGVIYNHRDPLQPGIYQVRVAARDEKSGRVGSAMQWVVIPNLSTKQLTLSSLLIGGQLIEPTKDQEKTSQAGPVVQFSVDHRFSHSSRLGFWLFIYNAAQAGTSAPDLTAQVQILRNGQSIVTTPQRKLTTAGMTDLTRIPYGGNVPLQSLAPGHYELRVTITDHLANKSASQFSRFEVN